MKDGGWQIEVRLWHARYRWAEHREGLVSPGARNSAGRVIDFIVLKLGSKTFEADAVDAYYQAPEHEEVVMEPAAECMWNDWPELGKTRTLCGDSCWRDDRQGRAGSSTKKNFTEK